MRDQLSTSATTTSNGAVVPSGPPPSRSDGSQPRIDREGAWSAAGTRTRSTWGDPARRTDGVFRCVLRGELDFSSRDTLAAVAREFASSQWRRAEVDVSDVTFVDSSALALLLAMRRTAVERGGDVVLLRPGRQLRRLLSLAGVSELFAVERTPL